ncbi:MAG: rhodanese-like domain-containing protein [Gammaproteobacteria bacterium]|nr:rhodanese-like domain-containing protein [Gammaproteobacteria bacterium]
MKPWIFGLTLILATNAAISSDYVFRNDERPTYNNIITVEQLQADEHASRIVLIDVRLAEDFSADPILIPGAVYRDPEDIEQWADQLPVDAKIVVYCVKGKWVSQKVASYLHDQGMDVQSLEGGIEAWKQTQD